MEGDFKVRSLTQIQMNGQYFSPYIFLLNTFQTAKRLVGVAQEVNLKEHVTRTPPPSANKAALSGFETQRRVTRSPKQGYQWPHKNDLCPPNFFF